MRKADREVKNADELKAILEKCDVCRLGLAADDVPYIVPMNFGYEYTDGNLTLYFHCAGEGKKLDILTQNPQVCFEMDCSHELKKSDRPCGYSMNYESIIGNGVAEICHERDEKIYGLTRLMEKYSDARTFEFPERELERVTVVRVAATSFTGKRLKKG
ncbi:MAG: pyridoxamine 5'-phosphate oxidase family protein [Clostridiales Family XIII bacterium]|jgi:nitroimidazol reductase NimA-like FMN-containing flavoprotein (pyridoxamine 5'-phosphate oxidase superfamily)|nr:pyridoxamine 5'-phosphate oxidase family protein [Clostridiales Family XIII bacterium]